MKSVYKICNIKSYKDTKIIREVISNNFGIIASEISVTKKEIRLIYNETCLNIQKIINSIEDLGYIVM